MDALTQFGPWVDDVLRGIGITILVTVLGAAGALVVAFVFGFLSRAKGVGPRFVARVFIEFFRGTSLLVQLWWLFFVLPLPPFRLIVDPLAVGVLAFSLNFGAYGAEIVRGAINAVPKAQWEATIALNMTPYERMRRVILPQAVVGMIPPFTNLLIQLVKSTPLVFTITIIDLTAVTTAYRSAEGNDLFIFTVSLVLYFVLAYALTLVMNALEARAKAAIGQREPRRKLFTPPFREPVESELI
jgi:polar amino acid transport system permease protein